MPSHTLLFAFFLVSVIGEYLHTRQELFELHLPIENNGGRNDDKVLTPNAFITSKVT